MCKQLIATTEFASISGARVKKYVPNAKILGITVQEMVAPSTEVIVGAVEDPQFISGSGMFVEILKDVTFRIAPINEREVREMITEIKTYLVLKGYRGLNISGY